MTQQQVMLQHQCFVEFYAESFQSGRIGLFGNGLERLMHPKQLPTVRNRANKSTQRGVDTQLVYYHVFKSIARHKLPENFGGLRLNIMDVLINVSSLHSGTSNPLSQVSIKFDGCLLDHQAQGQP